MQSYPDQFEALPFGEQFFLWSVRKWVWAHNKGFNTVDILREPFERIGATDSHYAFDGFMTILSLISDEDINIQCTCRSSVNEDENNILNIVAALQADDQSEDAVNLLCAWLPQAASRWAVDQCQLVADDLAKVGLQMRPHIIGASSNLGPVLVSPHDEVPTYLN